MDQHWPGRNGGPSGPTPRETLDYFIRFNDRIIETSDDFYSYRKPTDFRLERREVQVFSTRAVPDPKLEAKVRGTHADFLRFTSPVKRPTLKTISPTLAGFPPKDAAPWSCFHTGMPTRSPTTACAARSTGWELPSCV